MFQADEHLAGKMPSHGTETCAVVEAIVSLAAAGGVLGDAALFERAERITYNAMPAATTKDQVRHLEARPHRGSLQVALRLGQVGGQRTQLLQRPRRAVERRRW